MSAPPADQKIAKLLRLLGSDKPGEVVAAATALGRALKSRGRDWHDLEPTFARLDSEEPLRSIRPAPMSFGDLARFCRDNDCGRLTEVERRFVADMVRCGFDRSPTERQRAWLEDVATRLQRRAA